MQKNERKYFLFVSCLNIFRSLESAWISGHQQLHEDNRRVIETTKYSINNAGVDVTVKSDMSEVENHIWGSEKRLKCTNTKQRDKVAGWSSESKHNQAMGNYCSSSQKKDKDNVSEKSEEWVALPSASQLFLFIYF